MKEIKSVPYEFKKILVKVGDGLPVAVTVPYNCQNPTPIDKNGNPFKCQAPNKFHPECDCRWCVFNKEFHKANPRPRPAGED